MREGFSLFAFVLPPIWMLANRLWLVLVGYLVILALRLWPDPLFEIPDHWRYYATLALNLLVGFEADTLERWTLDRRNWRMVGTVSGNNFDECERRFFESWVPTIGIVTPSNFDKPGAVPKARRPRPGRSTAKSFRRDERAGARQWLAQAETASYESSTGSASHSL